MMHGTINIKYKAETCL